VRTLRADAALRDIPVVVISAVAAERSGTVIGAADTLNKPVDAGRMLLLLRSHLAGARA
jgi:CheY-like chemotaxis protein